MCNVLFRVPPGKQKVGVKKVFFRSLRTRNSTPLSKPWHRPGSSLLPCYPKYATTSPNLSGRMPFHDQQKKHNLVIVFQVSLT